jgi:hypothetical protein
MASGITKKVISPDIDPTFVDLLNFDARHEYCHKALLDGRVDGWYGSFADLNTYRLKHCDGQLHMNSWFRFGRFQFGLAMHIDNIELAHNISSALAFMEQSQIMRDINKEHFGLGKSLYSLCISLPLLHI